MPLIRCSVQKSATLEEFYQKFIPGESDTYADVGTPMLRVVNMVNSLFKETVIYGLTSHTTLILLNRDEWSSPWFVGLRGVSEAPEQKTMEYYIQYLMPPDKAPWPDALVEGTVTSLEKLENYLIIAMMASEGWPDCEELKSYHSALLR